MSVYAELERASLADPWIDVRNARCHICHPDSVAMIDAFIRGKEDRISRKVGRLFQQTIEDAARDHYSLRGDLIGHRL